MEGSQNIFRWHPGRTPPSIIIHIVCKKLHRSAYSSSTRVSLETPVAAGPAGATKIQKHRGDRWMDDSRGEDEEKKRKTFSSQNV